MDGEHIEMIISGGWYSTELCEKALVELGNIREELYILRQLSSGLTPLALDGGDSAASKQLSTPEVLSTLQGESTPAHRK